MARKEAKMQLMDAMHAAGIQISNVSANCWRIVTAAGCCGNGQRYAGR